MRDSRCRAPLPLPATPQHNTTCVHCIIRSARSDKFVRRLLTRGWILRSTREHVVSDCRSELEPIVLLYRLAMVASQPAEYGAEGESETSTISAQTTLGAVRIVIEAGWVAKVAALQVACIETHRSCRGCQSFRLRIARKTPRKVYQEKFAGGGDVTGGQRKTSSRVVLPRVVRLLYDLNKFDLKPGLRLPLEILSIVFGTAFGDSIDSVMWPPGLQSLVFWRRYTNTSHVLPECSSTYNQPV